MEYLDLNIDLTEEDIDLRYAARAFAQEVMRPIAKQLDTMTAEEVIAEGSPLWRFLKMAYEQNYHAILLPSEYGGVGLSTLQLHIVFEEMAAASVGLSVLMAVAGFPFLMACMTGDDELIEDFVKPFCECRDASMIGCWAITEPDHGSDIVMTGQENANPSYKMNVQAELDGDYWVINGQKSAWVSGGTIATHALLFPQIDRNLGMLGGGICICPLNLPGVSKGKPLEKVGQRDLNQGEIYFDNVRIPKKYMICEADNYIYMLEMVLATANACMGVFSTGIARAAFEEAFEYSKVRVQGGKPIIEHTSVRQRVFDMFARVEACRAFSRAVLNYNLNNNPPFAEYSIAAKTRCTQMAFEVAHEAVQILGGNGLSREYVTEKLFRDARAMLIEDGNNEMLAADGGRILSETYPR